MYKKFILGICFFFSTCVQAEIIEINDIDIVRLYIDQPGTLALFDIDDTLIHNQFSLGNSPWRNWVKPKLSKFDGDYVMYDALTLFIAKNIPYKAVQWTTSQLISDLQNDGIVAFAFTSRGRSEWYSTSLEGVDRFTHHQLNHANMDFKKTTIPTELQGLDADYFNDGVIFAKHITKGDLFKHLFKDLKYSPPLVVFVDDKLEQVQSVENVLQELGIPSIAFWYKPFELNDFDPMVTNVQLEHLLFQGEFINDEDAQAIVKTMSETDSEKYLKGILQKLDFAQLAPKLPFDS